MFSITRKKNVRKFMLDDDSDREAYEAIINDPECLVYNENFTYDKAGRAIITIWFYSEDEED
jgi:hypothetical protein